MNHAEIAEPLAAYALNAVDGEERVVIEQHLATCPPLSRRATGTPGGGDAAVPWRR